MTQAIDWQPLHRIIDANQRFVITSHVRPDADALGSELGLAAVLDSLGKTTRIINPSPTPRHLAFLDPSGRARKLGDGATAEEACNADVHFIVDTSARGQLDILCPVLDRTPARKIVIDHHVCGDELGATEIRDVSAAATGILITELAESMNVVLPPEASTSLFAAIATDTGWFRFPNTDSRTLSTVARLVERGARPHIVYRELYERSSLARLKLMSRVLDRVEVIADGRLAHTYVLLKDFKETGSHSSDTEDLVNEGLKIEGVMTSFILVEQPGGQVKASLRSRSHVDVAAVGREFGGGGHVQAAGATLPGPLLTAQQRVIEALVRALGPALAEAAAEPATPN